MMNTKEIESLMSSSNQFENNFDTNAFDLLIPIPSPRKLKSPSKAREFELFWLFNNKLLNSCKVRLRLLR
ncbi:hypothetical protein RIR_jg3511.t1 [Rhizophagus irregularis DAOM 181602=DAOM 197198]|nr:hypothetical protein RIR_jg3511.t1 [Rhizophagus irregularis DAOM 181602=DAOM 197198]